jgi:N6-L-threonylcarbamoyladenine synthase
MAKILAIETSCDETAAAVISTRGHSVSAESNIVSSQIKIHQKTFGVVPEVAARAHLQNIDRVVKQALHNGRVELKNIDYIAVTVGPGLVTSLLVGVEYAKSLSLATGKPIIPVNHMHGHLYSALLENPKLKFPSINLIVSGGHTYIVLMKSRKEIEVLGTTVDDAVGEAFDKVARMIGLKYPGGPEISKAAKEACDSELSDMEFPRPMINSGNYNFSFAGLKTAVLYAIRDKKLNVKSKKVRNSIALSFENAAVDVLVSKTIRAALEYKAKSITLSGGVAANKWLRRILKKEADKIKVDLYIPDFSLCTDNALMIGNAAAIMLQNGYTPGSYSKLKADPVLGI